MDKPLDKVTEAYYEKMGEEFGRKTRERIHWIVNQVQGMKVLDIGCSQGIIPILLGREGKKVDGIDISKESIGYAKESLLSEHESVQKNVAFHVGNIMAEDSLTGTYDTVVLTEVLEHIADTSSFLKKVKTFIKEDGCFIVTVPFGINDYFDHKRTYYYLELAEQLAAEFQINDVTLLGKWIGVVCQKREGYTFEERDIITSQAIKKLEAGFYTIERELLNKIDSYQKQLKRKNTIIENLEVHKKQLVEEKEAIEKQFMAEKANIEKQLIAEKENIEKQLKTEKENALSLLKKEIQGLKEEQKKSAKRLQMLENSLLRRVRRKYSTLRTKLKKKVAGEPNQTKNNKISISLDNISDLRMACIFDEFTMACYGKEAKLITFTPQNWLSILQKEKPHVLMVESAWRGNLGTWEYKIATYQKQDKSQLVQLLKWCKNNQIPTIFWNKEDPVHFDKFIDSAKMFDYIFTTDVNMIPQYQKVVKHDRVYPLPFSAQPKLHHPIKLQNERINKICFAGSYYGNRHEERKQDMEKLLDIAASYGLDIFDRNYEKNKEGSTVFQFPERFQKNIVGSLAYKEIDKAYKGYKVMLNVNSVKDSPTMFSRRVFEGLACGTPIISSYSEGIKQMFNDIVLVSKSPEQLAPQLQKLMTDEQAYREKSLQGIREIYLHHTYKHRIQYILGKIGVHVQGYNETVTVLAIIRSKEEFAYVKERFQEQTFPNKKLAMLLDIFPGYLDILNNNNQGNIRSYVLSYLPQYTYITEIIDSEYIGCFHPHNYYGENYLLDLMIASIYSESDVIGKGTTYVYHKGTVAEGEDLEYQFVQELKFDSAIVKRSVLQEEEMGALLEHIKQPIVFNNEVLKLFSADKYNYVYFGREIDDTLKEKIEI